MKRAHLKVIGLVSGAAIIFLPAVAEVLCTRPSEIRCQSFLAGTYCQGWWRCPGYNPGNPLDDHEVPEQVFVKATQTLGRMGGKYGKNVLHVFHLPMFSAVQSHIPLVWDLVTQDVVPRCCLSGL